MAKIQSVEPNVADLANGWMRSYKLDYKLEQESLNTEIDRALDEYFSKNGGVGGNRPDAKLLLRDKNMVNYPVLIEYKGYKDKLVALDSEGKVANKTAKNQPDFKHINSYAVNGAVHYANALLHYTSYTDIRLARVNMDSYVWDFATGSAGLLVAAMNEMLNDAKNKIKSPDEFARKSAAIKANQLLGLEILSEVYMLAILNMILMGDGSSNILNKDSLKEFNGNYGFGKTDEKFPADAFVLNPPYSAPGNGMVFVEKALSMMSKGYAAIIIQNSAGSGKATEYNKRILKHSTLLASIKMPMDLFIGKSSVQTNIYVFRVGETHQKDDTVKFIDFSVDGYTRTNRKKASCNLRDTDHAKERYQELVDLVRFGKAKLNIFTEKEYYEGTIDPENGADWNQTAPIDTKPRLEDFKKTVSDYLAWEVSNLLKNQNLEDDRLGK